GDTYAAAINAPVSVGDYISTDDGARGEIEFDYGSALRIAPDTQLRFTVLQPDHHVLQLAAGTVDLRVFRGLAAHAEIETPSATVRPAGDGSFRVTVTNDGNTEVTARSGRVDVVTSSGNQSLEPGPTLLITGNADRPQIQTIDAVAFDSFDSFNRSRDARVERSHDWAYVDAGFVGADDLDAYGRWSDVPGYGQVWQPTDQPDGWAPYTTGRWVWEPYYGWSWVDSSPWGYAPYHYGRWFYADANWYWSPGIAVAAPLYYSAPVAYYPHPVYYRPALVAFFSFGGGGGFGGGLGIGFGNVGWCALAPSEPFHPWYGSGYGGDRTIVNRTTIINNYGNTYVNGNIDSGNIARTYRNVNAPGGAVAVNNGNFANGNFTHLVRLQRTQLAGATAVRGVVPVVPTASNLAFSGHAIEPLATRAPVNTRFARFTTQPKVPFASFAEQQRAVQSVAVKTYPEHATVFQHPEIQQKYDRPGLITRENVPEEFKPSATVRGATTNEPAGARTEERGTYVTKPAVAPAQADPFARFSH
ncbi:MAG: FecR domain-containing protein, partial [Candidatus Eremiobacteraeota bacterium]|nr:FecR domain-containing protein [Candidatus Eremiobacteraeota bacterium]